MTIRPGPFGLGGTVPGGNSGGGGGSGFPEPINLAGAVDGKYLKRVSGIWVPASVTDADLSTAETDTTKVLAPDGAGGMSFRAEAGGGGGGASGALAFLEAHTASASAALVFTMLDDVVYDDYQVYLDNLLCVTNDVHLIVQFSTDGGATWITTGYLWSYRYSGTSGTVGDANSGSDSGIRVFGDLDNTAGGGYSGIVTLHGLGLAYKARVTTHGSGDSGGNDYAVMGQGEEPGTVARTAFRILFSSGNIASGTARLYGIAKAAGGGGSSGVLTEALASGDTTLTPSDTMVDVAGLSLTLDPGTYLVTAVVQFENIAGGAGQSFAAKLYDGGSTIYTDGSSVYGASWVGQIVLEKKIVLTITTTIKVAAQAQNAGDKVTQYDPVIGGTVPATTLIAEQMGGGGGGGGGRSFMGMVPMTAPPSAGWSWDNQGSSTIASVTAPAPDSGNTEYIVVPNMGAQFALRYRTVTFPKKVTFVMLHDFGGMTSLTGTGGEDQGAISCGLRDGTGKLIVFYVRLEFGQVATFTNSTGAGGTTLVSYGINGGTLDFTLRQPQFLQVEDDGTTLHFRVSIDGVTWVEWYSAGRTAFFGSGPTQVCWGGWSQSNKVHASLIGYDEV